VESGKKKGVRRTILHRFPSLEKAEHKGNQKKHQYNARVEETRSQKFVAVKGRNERLSGE
jgi:hypothetical protein